MVRGEEGCGGGGCTAGWRWLPLGAALSLRRGVLRPPAATGLVLGRRRRHRRHPPPHPAPCAMDGCCCCRCAACPVRAVGKDAGGKEGNAAAPTERVTAAPSRRQGRPATADVSPRSLLPSSPPPPPPLSCTPTSPRGIHSCHFFGGGGAGGRCVWPDRHTAAGQAVAARRRCDRGG
ncbi:hypothetical protein I4F81_009603 [Pyropia yezoensis]|uniref:Uncharacterized protein n=1 Tax=Pyropia yezoensis TaxID=2788 RepID=A0ACC3C9Z1_PYRYE|nr:hypothetical protein I4F81_009603 [Neopyropia yezoensis]